MFVAEMGASSREQIEMAHGRNNAARFPAASVEEVARKTPASGHRLRDGEQARENADRPLCKRYCSISFIRFICVCIYLLLSGPAATDNNNITETKTMRSVCCCWPCNFVLKVRTTSPTTTVDHPLCATHNLSVAPGAKSYSRFRRCCGVRNTFPHTDRFVSGKVWLFSMPISIASSLCSQFNQFFPIKLFVRNI